jgi:LacI family transcriptional regulator
VPAKRGREAGQDDHDEERRMALTIKDIAALAKVSTGTVSKTLNDAPGVGAQTRQRILKLVADLNFQPNASAQSLAARRTGNIGVVIPHTGGYSMASAFWPILLTSITEQAAARSLNVLLSTARSEEDVDSAYKSVLRGRRVDGLIVGAEQFGLKQLAELLVKDFPFVMVGKGALTGHYFVDVDNAGGAAEMTRHLVDLGHRAIVMLAGPEHLASACERVEGYRAAVVAAGLEPRVHHCAYQAQAAQETVDALLRSGSRPTALFVAAGDLVTPALRAIARSGLALPSDLALVAFDDHPLYEFFRPAITAVDQPIHDLGQAAVELLFTLMDGRTPERASRVLPTRLVVRASCGARR